MNLATRILIGLVLGIAAGLFFGERMSLFASVGQAFILLLQMTVLPYMAVSLLQGLGGLSAAEAVALAKRAGSFLLLLWAFTLFAVFSTPLAFPDWEAASFFSTNLVEQRKPFDFLGLFIPANPFRALSDAVVPSVVVFSVALGAALIGIPQERKRGLIAAFGTLSDALGRVTGFVVQLAPYGVFAIAADAAGTMSLDEAKGLQVYASVFVLLALVLTFWTLPGLVTTLTPLRYRDVVWFMRDALVTAFATGNLFVVLSVLAERSKELLRRHAEAGAEAGDALVDVVVPTAYTLPSSGKLMALCFVFFAGWLSGYAIPLTGYLEFLVGGVASFFGSTLVAVPFMLDAFQIPADLFRLFVVSDNIFGNRFGSMLAAMHVIALVLLSASATAGLIRVRPLALGRYIAITLVLTLGVVGLVRVTYEARGREYEGYATFVEMQPLFAQAKMRVLDGPPRTLPPVDLGVPTLERIRQRGFLRAGFTKDRLPHAFRNANNDLVGFHVEMLHQLALELGVDLEMVQVAFEDLPRLLNAGYLDMGGVGMAVTTQRLEQVSFAQPHAEETLAFVVRDHRRDEFSSRAAVQRHKTLRLAVLNAPYYIEKVKRYLPQAELVLVESPRDFFRDTSGALDALVFTAESGSAWSLVYPSFSVAVPRPDVLTVPLAFPVARGNEAMVELLSTWIGLKQRDKTIERLYEHWILGQAAAKKGPRWSIVRDVLHWVD
jgi:Na+/H+-dicarboxylate symporter